MKLKEYELAKAHRQQEREKWLTAGVSTWERLEAVFEEIIVCLSANARSDEYPGWIKNVSNNGVYGEVGDAIEIWLAPRQQVWPRLSKQVLHALSDQKGRRK